jgi:hypothetical protein
LISTIVEEQDVHMNTQDKKPKCRLSGMDGNVFNVINLVSLALVKAGLEQDSVDFRTKALSCKTYGDVIAVCFDYVDVK